MVLRTRGYDVDLDTAEERVLATADALFYERGVQAVGMDAIRAASGVSLKRLYQAFPSKDHLVQAALRRRDRSVREAIGRHLDAAAGPEERILAVFDYLDEWFREPDFRGCAFINAYAELGPGSADVADLVRVHKEALQSRLAELVAAAARPPALADQLAILANGAMVLAGISGTPEPARQAHEAARLLIDAS
jgi:AcrR family transcriptional regulator